MIYRNNNKNNKWCPFEALKFNISKLCCTRPKGTTIIEMCKILEFRLKNTFLSEASSMHVIKLMDLRTKISGKLDKLLYEIY